MCPPRIMPNESALEKYAVPGISLTVSLPALMRSASSSPFDREGPDAEHAILALQNHVHPRRNVIRHQRGQADAKIHIEAITQFARNALHNAIALLGVFRRFGGTQLLVVGR